jgi:Glycine-zipper domain
MSAMRLSALALVVVIGTGLVGCGNTTASRSVSGAGLGAAGGAAFGAIAGNAALGAGIGAGVGLVGGYLYDQHKKGNIDY